MTDRPILFSAPMVRALLAGTKTQTRRVVKIDHRDSTFMSFVSRPIRSEKGPDVLRAWFARHTAQIASEEVTCPYGKPGDRLWVRESLAIDAEYGHYYAATGDKTLGNASGRTYLCNLFPGYDEAGDLPERGVPSIHLPRRYSRITLEITGVRVERLQQISEDDCRAEGIREHHLGGVRHWDNGTGVLMIGTGGVRIDHAYRSLWESINGAGSWDANPWVWVIEFKRLAKT